MADRFDSVWDAIGRSPTETGLLKQKAALMRAVSDCIRENDWEPPKAAKAVGVAPARAADLMSAKLSAFSVDELREMAKTLGLQI